MIKEKGEDGMETGEDEMETRRDKMENVGEGESEF